MSDQYAAFGVSRFRKHVGTVEWVGVPVAMEEARATVTPLCGRPYHRLVSEWDMIRGRAEIDELADAGRLCRGCEVEWLIRTRGRDDIVAQRRREQELPPVVQEILDAEDTRRRGGRGE